MGLQHDFYLLERSDSMSKIDEWTKKAILPDTLVLYMLETFDWCSFNWTNTKKKPGLNYYGDTILVGEELSKFANILKAWREVFCLAPEKFEMTKEREVFRKVQVVYQLGTLIELCEEAYEKNMKLIHWGV
ncbi:MAG: hypothetical protein LBM95_04440 [Lactobacillales bacterium]|jgi:hypothetical protein|nr:hypothetical protein [Lactobacillales bacterium]